jgi:ABC-type branched-subunit amino acid transport system substrate-binding protein
MPAISLRHISFRPIAIALCVAFAAALSGCQSAGTGDVLDLEGAANVQATEVTPEIAGKGETRIALAIPLSGGQAAAGKEIRQGAELALDELGAGKIALAFYDTAGTAGRVKGAAEGISAAGTKLAAVAADPATLAAFAPQGAVSVAFVTNETPRPAGTFAFLPSAPDSLVYGVRTALAAKPGEVVLFVPDAWPDGAAKMLEARLAQMATTHVVRYGTSRTSAQIAQSARKDMEKATVIAFAGNETKIAQIAKALTLPGQQEKPAIVGNMDWPDALLKSASLDGALIPVPDTGNHEIVAGRYTKKYGTAPTVSALYAFDFVAVAAGIVRARGAEGLSRATLTGNAGFRGATGAFRFRPDGRVERLYAVSIIDKGQPKPLQKPAEGF